MCPLGYIKQSKAATFCIFHDYELSEKLKFHNAYLTDIFGDLL